MREGTSAHRYALIVPECTDVNRGDQALVWEAARLLQESGVVEAVRLLDGSETAEERAPLIGQSLAAGYPVLKGLRRHPRRGRNRRDEHLADRLPARLRMMACAGGDFVASLLFLLCAPCPALARLGLSAAGRETYDAFRAAHVVVVKGGGFLHAYGGLTGLYYIWYQLYYFLLALRLGKPVVVLPNSYGPFLGPGVRLLLRWVLTRCRLIWAREGRSAAMVAAELGLTVPVAPDMAFSLVPASRATGEAICRQAGVPLGTVPCVGITVRPYRFPQAADPGASYTRYLAAIAALVRHIAARGWHPVLVTHVIGPNAHEDDRLAIEAVRQQLGDTPHSWIDSPGDCRAQAAIYGCFDYLVGTRFHSVIFALTAGVPSLAIAYGGNKGEGIMTDMGLADYVLPIDTITPEALLARFDQLVAAAPEIRAQLREWQAHCAVAQAQLRADLQAALAPLPARQLAGKE
jgi:colanic acid/amylovoran biosynthesis protein